MTDTRSPLVSARLDDLRTGLTLRHPLYERQGQRSVLLLSAGTLLTPELLERLRDRSSGELLVDGREYQRIVRTAGSVPPSHADRSAGPNHAAADRDDDVDRTAPYSAELDREVRAHREAATRQLDDLFVRLAEGEPVAAEAAADISSGHLTRLAADRDLFAAIGIEPEQHGYPTSHSLQTAMLAAVIGAEQGLGPDLLREIGMGCLLHDAGMLLIDRAVPDTRRNLSPVEFVEIQKHPLRIHDRLLRVPDVPPAVRSVAYQMHERCDGSGYPRGIAARNIEPAAKCAAVADVYLALVSPRPHRPGLLPCRAMERILQEVKQGRLDSEAVRALLRALSLFPLGSYVHTSDGRVGRVLRSNGTAYLQPVVELWDPCGRDASVDVVDLSAPESAELQIVGPLPDVPPRPAPLPVSLVAGGGAVETDFPPSVRKLDVDADMWE